MPKRYRTHPRRKRFGKWKRRFRKRISAPITRWQPRQNMPKYAMTSHIMCHVISEPTFATTNPYETNDWWLGKLNSCYPVSGDTSVPYLYPMMGQIYKNAVVLSSVTTLYYNFPTVSDSRMNGWIIKHKPDKYGLYIDQATAADQFPLFWHYKNFTLKRFKSGSLSTAGSKGKLKTYYNIKKNDEVKNPLEEPDFWISYNNTTSTWTEPTNKHYWSWTLCPEFNPTSVSLQCIVVQKQKVLWFNHQLAEIAEPALDMEATASGRLTLNPINPEPQPLVDGALEP